MKNYYEILGVQRTSTPDDIKKAYRQKASLYHPDKEGGSKVKFQEVEEAYRTLSDPGKRAQYDNPQPQFHGFGRHETPFDMDAIFNMFGARFQQQQRRAQMTLWITLQDVAQGGRKTISIGTQQGTYPVEIEMPQGINDGDNVQYSGIGPGGMDLIITYRIHPSPRWQRQGQNLVVEETISIWDLIVGCDLPVKDILGNSLILTVPPRTQPGSILRLRGRGLRSKNSLDGDLLVKMQAKIPENIDDQLLALIEENKVR